MNDEVASPLNNLLASSWAQDYAPVDSDLHDPWTHINEIAIVNDTQIADMNLKILNASEHRELDDRCKLKYVNKLVNFPDGFCNTSFDSITCWPPTAVNTTAYEQCFSEFLGYKYDDTQNASRQCLWNGTWSKTDYTKCVEINENTLTGIGDITHIYFAGHSFSLVALTIAIGIFIYFKDLRCLRNTIHTHLMCAYLLHYLLWILNLISEKSFENNTVSCVFLMILLHYFHSTTFFWMFVEGLYLYILVVETLTRENFKLRIYVCIGWGLPVLSITIWAITKCFIATSTDSKDLEFFEMWKHCPWMRVHLVDWIFQAPIIIVLLSNFIFLIAIMWVLITKLRSANTLETQQYRKAAKALLVLMPLLGVTYVLTIAVPTTDSAQYNVFDHIRAVLLSVQGFTVALFYCFLNTEVQNTLRHHFGNWNATRNIGPRRLRAGSRSKECSPRSRTESIRCTEWTLVPTDDAVGQVLYQTETCNGKRPT